jgi:GTP pyrophosphokinase
MTIKKIIASEPGGLVARAYRFAEKAHSGQKRKSGGAYFEHLLATAEILSGWRLDDATIAAGLLHDSVEDTDIPLEAIEKEFGGDVAFLVDGVTKLGRLKYRGTEGKIENLRKLILALSQDLRVVFIKLADRLHNMRTLDALPPPKQKRVALETDEIYAPLAYRLGMQNLSGELHDLAFPRLHPEEYEWLKKTVKEKYEERAAYLKKIKPIIEAALKENDLSPAAIDFRAKRISSLYGKLLRHNMDIEKIYDLVAMRIVVNTISDCYATLGIIHNIWPPLPGRIKDYIAMPKPNGYRSLHTTVIGPEEKIIEFQIRTKEMHEENENGIAAHWLYEQTKHGEKKVRPQKIAGEVRWVQQLRNWLSSRLPERNGAEKSGGAATGPEDFLQAMKIDFFKDRIFAITPRGDVIDLPVGATPVDFAYHIHSEVGNSCVGAKVNDQLVPLDHELHSGDLVQILTQKNKKPSEDWLKLVKTAAARDHIRAALRHKQSALRAKGPSRAEIKIITEARIGIIKDISSVMANSHLKILSFNTPHSAGSHFAIHKVGCDTTDKKKLEKIVLKIRKLGGVREVSFKLI